MTVTARGLVPAVAPLVAGATAISGPTLRAQVSGGTDGESYLVTVDATGSDGGTYEAEAEVRVIDLTYAAADESLPYVSIAQLIDRVGLDELIRLTDTLGAGRVDTTTAIAVLTDAQAIADGFIAQAGFGVPLPTVPQLVTTLVLDLAEARLYGAGVPEGVAQAKTDAMAMLKAIALGQVKLPLVAVEAATAVSPTPIFASGRCRVFGRVQF